MMNYSGPDKKNSGSSFDNQDFGIYGRGYEGYAHYMQAVKESGSSSDDFLLMTTCSITTMTKYLT